jgi:hypothetical protein
MTFRRYFSKNAEIICASHSDRLATIGQISLSLNFSRLVIGGRIEEVFNLARLLVSLEAPRQVFGSFAGQCGRNDFSPVNHDLIDRNPKNRCIFLDPVARCSSSTISALAPGNILWRHAAPAATATDFPGTGSSEPAQIIPIPPVPNIF